ncbi:putative reverse transcriptase [Orientia tsutsugamushi str. Gilliam]|uniref:Reverse transcriptase n=1 Tax=Orientia tsutsugamushi str. Gilliam TaxID=1359184 RepID=A0A0F3MBQ3_ORITS|nr:hypothetical protein [Orientia tsutsugamushi]KJV50932.1 putative reverse transcriptase [Orientia tsutsugamushi str. Gilliam]KJV53175.1 putative reverse transcriptase [Orientia tsutsugamushi str. Gilliam]SPR03542.1 reverse transcriptase [Orientia tsutsugamushi str. Gilliam]SPR06369.1 reverse transcriptase [Orientia tsutsugamushi str. Gilliam]SPR12181.1 reverse transcriptase [Orientia tsutsugamushi str. Gilliam]
MTVHSIDRKTWLTKLERIKLLSSQNQDIKFNNLGHIIDLKMYYRKNWSSKADSISMKIYIGLA